MTGVAGTITFNAVTCKKFTMTWTIDDIISRWHNFVINSPIFSDGNQKWFLSLSPNVDVTIIGRSSDFYLQEEGQDVITNVTKMKVSILDDENKPKVTKEWNRPSNHRLKTFNSIGFRSLFNLQDQYKSSSTPAVSTTTA